MSLRIQVGLTASLVGIVLLVGCPKPGYRVKGVMQKGPYVTGSSVTIQELDSALAPTGATYSTEITDDLGHFSIGSSLTQPLIEIRNDGYYFSELSGSLSTGTLSLRALADVSTGSTVNVNLLTHLSKNRVRFLVEGGMSFAQATAQAEQEVISAFGISNVTIPSFHELDVTQPGESHGVLLAVSAVLEQVVARRTVRPDAPPAELTELLSAIATDLQADGVGNSPLFTSGELAEAAYALDNGAIRSHLANRLAALGAAPTVAPFEQFVAQIAGVTACASGAECTERVCVGGLCRRPSCADNVANGDETDVDCGGGCPKCHADAGCSLAAHCISGICQGGHCEPTCSDGERSGAETDVDCGGPCTPCPTGASCAAPSDCVHGVCKAAMCMWPLCDDGVQNGTESDVDCGGGSAGTCGGIRCAVGRRCGDAFDCQTWSCDGGVCREATCSDGWPNGSETGLDCGGPCPPCGFGGGCADAGDCVSKVCSGGSCQAKSCNDWVQNGIESDVDCGGDKNLPDGGLECPACRAGAACTKNTECTSGLCDAGTCWLDTCFDGIQNGQEAAVDCGGNYCRGCGPGAPCGDHLSCLSRSCVNSVCQ